MLRIKNSSDAFTGLEAAIVLIAFVVVAAVFSYVILGAGFFTTQKSQETVYKATEQATSNLQIVGQVYGSASDTTGTSIKHIQFNLGLVPGSPALDLSKMIIAVSQPDVEGLTQLTYGTTASATVFTATSGTPQSDPVVNGVLKSQQQAIIKFDLATPLRTNGQINIELRPGVGAALPIVRTAPPSIVASQVLV